MTDLHIETAAQLGVTRRTAKAINFERLYSSDEARALDRLPKVTDQVSDANPEPWTTWLPARCEVRDRSETVVFWGSVNCNYLVYRDRVIANYGYHGRNVFRYLHDEAERAEFFARVAAHQDLMDGIRKGG